MKKSIVLLMCSLLIFPARAVSLGDFKSSISCIVATGLAYSLDKDKGLKIGAALCGGIATYHLIDGLDEPAKEEFKQEIAKEREMVIEQSLSDIKKQVEEAKGSYKVYQDVIREAVAKKMNSMERKFSGKINRKLKLSSIKKKIEAEVLRSLNKMSENLEVFNDSKMKKIAIEKAEEVTKRELSDIYKALLEIREENKARKSQKTPVADPLSPIIDNY